MASSASRPRALNNCKELLRVGALPVAACWMAWSNAARLVVNLAVGMDPADGRARTRQSLGVGRSSCLESVGRLEAVRGLSGQCRERRADQVDGLDGLKRR